MGSQVEETQAGPDQTTTSVAPRRSKRTTGRLDEDPQNPNSEVKDAQSAQKFLITAGFIPKENKDIALPQLALILRQITLWAKVSDTGTDAIRAVSYIMETFETESLIQQISKEVSTTITHQMEKLCKDLGQNIEQEQSNKTQNQPNAMPTDEQLTTQENMEYISMSLEELNNKVDENKELTHTILETLSNTDNNVDSIATKLDEITPHKNPLESQNANPSLLETVKSSIEELKNRIPPANLIQAPMRQRPASYAAAVSENNLTRVQREIMAQSEVRDWQVALKCTHDKIQDLTEKDLTTMVTQALTPPNDQNDHPTFYCRSVRKTKGEVIIVEMSNKEGAKWLSNHQNRTDFTNKFNLDTQILDPFFKTHAEFIPVSLNPEDPTYFRDIEAASNLPSNTISRISWIRRPSDQKPNQKVAHAFIFFNSPEAANYTIRSGLVIEGKNVAAFRLYPEPMHCFHCQELGNHLINECPSHDDTCGTCGEHTHRTPQCSETNTNNLYCVNCRLHGHASWDRLCPTFVKERNRIITQHPDGGCKYFPINDDPSTWPKADTPPRKTPSNNHQLPPPTQQPHPSNADDWTTTDRHRQRKTPTN